MGSAPIGFQEWSRRGGQGARGQKGHGKKGR